VIFGENRSATPESRICANFRTIRHCHVSSSPSNNNSYNNKTVCRSSDSQTQEADEGKTLSRFPRIWRPNEFSPGFQAHESTDGCSTTGTGRKLRILERNFRLLEKELQSDHMFSMLAVSCLYFRKSFRKQVSKRGSNLAFKTRNKSLQVRSTSPKAYLFFQRSQTGSQSSEQQANRDYTFRRSFVASTSLQEKQWQRIHVLFLWCAERQSFVASSTGFCKHFYHSEFLSCHVHFTSSCLS